MGVIYVVEFQFRLSKSLLTCTYLLLLCYGWFIPIASHILLQTLNNISKTVHLRLVQHVHFH